MAVSGGPHCTALGCRETADVVIALDAGRERPVCDGHSDDGEVVDDV